MVFIDQFSLTILPHRLPLLLAVKVVHLDSEKEPLMENDFVVLIVSLPDGEIINKTGKHF